MMGAVYGIDIYHKGYSGNSNYHSTYEIFSLKELEKVLEKATKGKDFEIIRIKKQRLLLQYSSEIKIKTDTLKRTEQLVINTDVNQNKTILSILHFTPKLYGLIIKLVEQCKIQIHFDGMIPVYTPETIHQYRNGSYWFVYNISSNEIESNAVQIATDFLNNNEYWNFNFFVQDFGYVYFNNYTDQPLDGFYNITIGALGEEEHHDNITLKESRKLLKRFISTLLKRHVNNVSVIFQPIHKTYYDVRIEIEGYHNPEDLIQTYLDINIDCNKEDIKCYDVERLSEQIIKVFEIQKNNEREYYEIEINEEGLQNGLIYTDKMYNENVFDFLCTEIASNFCPCSPVSEYNFSEKLIYYKLEKDKEILQKLYSSYVQKLIFKKV